MCLMSLEYSNTHVEQALGYICLKGLSCEEWIKLLRRIYKVRRYEVLELMLEELLPLVAGKSNRPTKECEEITGR